VLWFSGTSFWDVVEPPFFGTNTYSIGESSHHRMNLVNVAPIVITEGGEQSHAKKRPLSRVSSSPSPHGDQVKSTVIVLKDDFEPRILDFDPSSIKIESESKRQE
jgi:hypothetical protein